MSIKGSFGLCSKSTYDSLVNSIRDNQFEDTKDLTNNIYSQLYISDSDLANDTCSGEVFIALFDYFKTEFEITIRENIERKEIVEHWREITGDYDVIAFLKKKKQSFYR